MIVWRRRLIALAFAALGGLHPAAFADPGDQVAIYSPVRPVTDVYHGVKVTESYRWLEDAEAPLTQTWVEAQNLRTRNRLDALPSRPLIRRDLERLTAEGSPAYSQITPAGPRVFALLSDPRLQQGQLVALDAQADPASRQVVIDPNRLDPAGLTAIDWFVPAPDGRSVAVCLSRKGSEDGTLHIYDVATGRELEPPIPEVQYPTGGGDLAWARNGRDFWYTRYPGAAATAAERHFHQQVYFHRRGADWRDDALALGPRDGTERISEIHLGARPGPSFTLGLVPGVSLDLDLDQGQALASVERGDGGAWAHYLLQPGRPAIRLADYGDQVVSAAFGPDGAVYGVSRAGAPNGQVLRLARPEAGASLARAPVIVPQSDVAILTGAAAFHRRDLDFDKRHLFVRDIVGGPVQVRVFDLTGQPLFKLPLPPVSANSEIAALSNGDVLFDVSTYLAPRAYLRWTPATGATRQTPLSQTSPIDFSDAEVVRAFATSRDGTQVPMSIIRRRGLRLDGKAPTLLYGYGGYGLSQSPVFLGALRRLWLDEGGVYVVANIRGGGEYGERWHQLGALTYKQNAFDDFAAAAQSLIAMGYASSPRLALMGGSNGGLLMGAMITQHPSLARAVVSSAGIYDMLRVERDPNGAFNTTEFGSVQDEAQFKALLAYSPYHHVRPGAYPAVLMLTGDHDGRVNPMQSRKFAAALQAANSAERPILLRTSANSGHGQGSAVSERLDEQADELAFLFDQLSLRYQPPALPGRAESLGRPGGATVR